jgi:hypothetical protein
MSTANPAHRPSEEPFRRWGESKMAMAPTPNSVATFSQGPTIDAPLRTTEFSKGKRMDTDCGRPVAGKRCGPGDRGQNLSIKLLETYGFQRADTAV